MPKRILNVDQHKDKEKIVKALIKGRPFSEITGKWGIAKSTLSDYLNDKLIPAAAKYTAQQDLKDGKFILEEIESIMSKMRKLYDACDEYLTDPSNKDKYSLLPRAWEQEIRYLDYSQVTPENQKPQQKTMELQTLLDMMNDHKQELVYIKYKFHDPRKIITETATVLTKQLELLARIQGTIKDVTINIINNPMWIELQAILLEVTDQFPEIRESLATRLSKLSGGKD